MSPSVQLKSIFDEDQADRTKKLWEEDPQLMQKRDDERLRNVLDIIEKFSLEKGEDLFRAAMVLQHGNLSKHYLTAHEYAKRAHDLGVTKEFAGIDPLWLSAAAKDRYLMSLNKPQLFGTQYVRDSNKGKWHLWEVDPSITDEERAKWHVQPLSEQIANIGRLNSES